jgi:hypothetical protein
LAARYGDLPIIRLLVRAGADIDAKNYGWCAFPCGMRRVGGRIPPSAVQGDANAHGRVQ